MKKRIFWLLLAVSGPLIFLWGGWLQGKTAVSHALSFPEPDKLIINEWSQGTGGSQEWIELLVVSGPADLRGWSLQDGNSSNQLRFTQAASWQAVAAGTLLIIYNGSAPDTVLPADDIDLSDCTAVLAHDASAYFSGNWPGFANSNSSDNPRLLDMGGAIVHDFSSAPGSSRHPGSLENAQYESDTIQGIAEPAQWTNKPASSASPGIGNNPANQTWIEDLCQSPSAVARPDLAVAVYGPETAVAGDTLPYTMTVTNQGNGPATGVLLTSTLPALMGTLLDNSDLPGEWQDSHTYVWSLGTVTTETAVILHLTATLWLTASGTMTHTVQVSQALSETILTNNEATAVTQIGHGRPPAILIDAVLYDGVELGDADEAVALFNRETYPVNISSWSLVDGGGSSLILPDGIMLPAQERFWIAKDATAFQRQFGFAPHLATATWPLLANSGDQVALHDAAGQWVDVVIYEAGDPAHPGWSGTAVQPYAVTGVFGTEGQIIFRQQDLKTGMPIGDSNQASDWAQSHKQLLFPGWDMLAFQQTTKITETAVLTIAIAPDNAFETVLAQIQSARQSIQIETHTFEHIGLGQALVAAAQRGVTVTLLLEGGPPGGMDDAQRYNCQQLAAVNGRCVFMISDSDQHIADRYRYIHAKFMLIDGQRAMIGSENLSPNSLPDDRKQDGTWGRRGVVLVTDAPGVVAHLQSLFDLDLDEAHHVDLFTWEATHTTYGAPHWGYVPITLTGGITYNVRYTSPLVVADTFAFELVQSPENSLRPDSGLLGLVNQAGAGDVVLVQQLQERPYWGATNSNAQTNPNLRLEAYLAAARRGARVRILLDDYFNDDRSPVSNGATCAAVRHIAQTERLDLACALGNPTGLGIHNKMVLVQINGRGTIHIGSINGSELSSKGNRELALQVQSDALYAFLAEMFRQDWPYTIYLPLLLHQYVGPADHILISEVLYNPPGIDTVEFIELVNPTGAPVDMSDWSIGDAVNRDDYEDVRHFPLGTILHPQQTLVIATHGHAFFAEYGRWPNFEILDSGPEVPNLIDNPDWGSPSTFLQLGNLGDEVILRGDNGGVIDVMVYGTGKFNDTLPCPAVSLGGASLERFPYWRDTDVCATDFREWAFPNPGFVP